MRIQITLDHYDGSKSKVTTVDLDGTGLNQIAFMLMNASVCGATITKCNSIVDVLQRQFPQEGEQK